MTTENDDPQSGDVRSLIDEMAGALPLDKLGEEVVGGVEEFIEQANRVIGDVNRSLDK